MPETSSETVTPDVSLRKIPIEQLKPNPWNRTQFDPSQLEDLINSIKVSGIKEPLIVRKINDGNYQIASGHRRWLAAQTAGLKEVPCWVQDLSNEDVQDMNLIANVQKEDVPPLQLAQMIDARMKAGGLKQLGMASLLGKSQQWVSEILGFLDLPKEVRESTTIVVMKSNQLRALKSLPPDHQLQVAKELKEGTLKPEEVHKRANQLKFTPKNGAKAGNQNGGAETSSTTSPAAPPPVSKGSGTRAPDVPAVPAGIVGDMMVAGKTQAVQHILSPLGNMGTVLQKAKGLKTWQVVLLAAGGYVAWHLCMSVVNLPMRLFERAINRMTQQATSSAPAAAVAQESPSLTPAMLTRIPAPTGLKADLMSGRKVHLSWNPVPGVFGYNVYSAYETNEFVKETPHPIQATEGLWSPDGGRARYRLAVTALDREDHESVYSQALSVDMR